QEENPAKPNPEAEYHLGPQLVPLSANPDTTTDNAGPLLLDTSCPNSNFSTGTWANWTGCYGLFDSIQNCTQSGFLTTGAHPLHKIIQSPGYEDVRTCYGLINVFPGESFSARLGDTMYTSQPSSGPPIYKEAELKYAVNVNSNSYLFIYRYAIILQSGNHASNIQPDFKVQITNAAGVVLDPICGSYHISAQQSGTPAPGWYRCQSDPNGDVYWKPWTTVGMDLTPYYGQTVYLNFKVRGCTYNTHYGYAYISSYCSALAIQIGLCAGSSSAILTAPPGFQSYEWRGPGYFGSIIGTTPSITIGSPQPGDIYYVNLTAVNGCQVNDLSQEIVFTVINSNFTFTPNCAGQASTFTDASTINQNAVVNWHWDFGDLSPIVTGVQNPTHIYSSPGTYTVTLTSYSTEGCIATSTHNITIPAAPVPTLTGPLASCVNGPALTYTTDAGKSNYVWNIPPGAILVAGGTATSNTATIDFNTLGPNVVGVSYTIPSTMCSAAAPTTLTVSVDPQPSPSITGESPTCKGVAGKTYTTQPGKQNYNWTIPPQATPSAGGTSATNFVTVTWTASGTYNISVNYTDPVSLCTADLPATFPVTVNPLPTVNSVTNQVLCHNAQTSLIQFSGTIPGTTYSWTNNNTTIGLAATGTGDIPDFTAINATSSPVIATITVTPSFDYGAMVCTGTPVSFNITVNPIPTTGILPNQVFCHNALTNPVQFTGNVTGTVFGWTNDNTSIGLAATGTGNIAAFTATNAGTTPVKATITVTPSFTNAGITCTGLASQFTITVNPLPDVNTVVAQLLCHNLSTTTIQFSGSIPSTTFNWTNDNSSIGLASSGTGNIPSFTVTNTTTGPQVANIAVTPLFTNAGTTCPGLASPFTITVNPVPTINPVANQAICHNAQTALVHFSSDVPGAVYTWTNNNASIGLAASGTGDIAAFTAL
ncbi:MAG: PKD domain-containing protein, partial [Bacteroidota bacterium]